MMVHQGFLSFSFCSSRFLSELRSAKLYSKNKHGAQHMSCFEEFKYSSVAFQSAIPSTLSLEVVLCHS